MKTILVVDDELANAEVLSLILEDEGYRVFCASNGQQGLERLAQVRPDLVILDYMMPIMNGAEMARAMRADPATSGIPILMNSSLSEEVVRRHFDGYDGFLRKPYNIELALRLIAQLVAGRRD
ncbi:MAG TPA: response regulator [Burkholderiaceae bacterium]|nr:response regulator [Burkholderiaceae bacterium]